VLEDDVNKKRTRDKVSEKIQGKVNDEDTKNGSDECCPRCGRNELVGDESDESSFLLGDRRQQSDLLKDVKVSVVASKREELEKKPK